MDDEDMNRLRSLHQKADENGDLDNEEINQAFEMAFEGDCHSMNNLGAIYLQLGCRQHETHDYDMALEFYEMAIKNGSGPALTGLGCMYENGYGIPVNKDKARILYEVAVDRKVPYAKKILDNLDNPEY